MIITVIIIILCTLRYYAVDDENDNTSLMRGQIAGTSEECSGEPAVVASWVAVCQL